MSEFPQIVLRNHKTDAVKRFHPWIFSGAIKKLDDEVGDGAIVEVYSEKGEYLATGIYNESNIAVKILSFSPIKDLKTLFLKKLQQAYQLRAKISLTENNFTNCYRLVNAEGDGLPGLIIDWYAGSCVLQTYSFGMYQQRHLLVESLQQIYGENLRTVYDKSSSVLHKLKDVEESPYLFGSGNKTQVLEYGHAFNVDWKQGQKTGFFLDQRENRYRLSEYSAGKKVLNTFCYSGGFSIYALQGKAQLVHSVDSSKKAIALTQENLSLNNLDNSRHQSFVADAFNFLSNCDGDYDVIILDPPAFAKNISARHQAMMAYKRINQQALTKINSGGIIFTFSCSQVIDAENFRGAVTAAAIESGRQIKILERLSQPADHPVSIYHPEGLYLKGLVLLVD